MASPAVVTELGIKSVDGSSSVGREPSRPLHIDDKHSTMSVCREMCSGAEPWGRVLAQAEHIAVEANH
eukprot:COSAG06_NODE_39870_length_408_cov_0.469256_1_plen_67_part_01